MDSSKIAKVLQACKPLLVKWGFYSPGLVDRLLSEGCITAEDMEEVNLPGFTTFNQSRKLIDILAKKADSVLDTVLAYLNEDGTQSHLERSLFEAAKRFGYYGGEGDVEGAESGRVQVLPEKWWPQKKEMILSFVERYDEDGKLLVDQVRSQLVSSRGGVTAIVSNKQVFVGMGGIGKTSMAKWYANAYEAEYEHIVWLDSEGSTLNTSFKQLGSDLSLPKEPEPPFEKLVSKIYEKFQEASCLFIFDNAERFDGPNGLQTVLPRSKSHHAIITSRNHDWGNPNEFGQISTFELDLFTKTECITLLSSTVEPRKRGSVEEMLSLGNELGYLPLALQCAVATINKSKSYTVGSYLIKIREDLKSLVDRRILNEYESPIRATLQLSIQQIENDEMITEECRELCKPILNLIAYCEPTGIPVVLLESLPSANPSMVEDAIDQLTMYSILSSEGQGRVSVHRLLQHAIRQNLLGDTEKACEIVKLVLRCMQTDLVRFEVHALHAWLTVSACPELNAIQRTCHQFPYTLSRFLQNRRLFLYRVIENMKRVYDDYELPMVQIKLALIDLLHGVPIREHMKELQILFDDMLHAVTNCPIVPFRPQLLLHLRIIGLKLQCVSQADMRLGKRENSRNEILETYEKVLREIRKTGYDGIIDGIRLHYFASKYSHIDSSSMMNLSLRLWVVLDYVQCLCASGQLKRAIDLAKLEVSLRREAMDIDAIWIVATFLLQPECRGVLTALSSTLYKMLDRTIMSTDSRALVVRSEKVSQRITSKSRLREVFGMTDPVDKILKTLQVLANLANMLTLSWQNLEVPEGILDGMQKLLDEIFDQEGLPFTSRDMRACVKCLPDVLNALWRLCVTHAKKRAAVGHNIGYGSLFQIVRRNVVYSFILLATKKVGCMLDVDTDTKAILDADRTSADLALNASMRLLPNLFAQTHKLTIANFVNCTDRLTPEEKTQVLESKLTLVLHVMGLASSNSWIFENIYTSRRYFANLDDACYLQLSLGQISQATALWTTNLQFINWPKMDLQVMVAVGCCTLALLESKHSKLMHAFMQEIGNCVLKFINREESIDFYDGSIDEISRLLIRLVTHNQDNAAKGLISKLETVPGQKFTQCYAPFKELLSEWPNLSGNEAKEYRMKKLQFISTQLKLDKITSTEDLLAWTHDGGDRPHQNCCVLF